MFLHDMDLAYLMHSIILLSAHACSHTLDHAEPELEEPKEQTQVEDLINLALDQGVTPRVSNPHDYVNHMFKRP
jgi:hypothetical protein